MDGGANKIGSKRQGSIPVDRMGPGWSTRLEEARIRRVAALAARKTVSPADLPKPWDAVIETTAPKLVDETRVNLRSAARLQPKPISENTPDTPPEENLDRALAAVGTGAMLPALVVEAEATFASRRRSWGAVAVGIFLLSASALAYGLVRGPLGSADWLPPILAQGPEGNAVDTAEPAAVAGAQDTAALSPLETEVFLAPTGLSVAPAAFVAGGAQAAIEEAPSFAAAPGVPSIFPVGRLASPTPGEPVPERAGPAPAPPPEAGPTVLASLDVPPVPALADVSHAVARPVPEAGLTGTRASPVGFLRRPVAARAFLPDPRTKRAPMPYDIARALAALATPAKPAVPDLPVPTGVQTYAPIALTSSGVVAAPDLPQFAGADAVEHASVAAILAAPEAGPPAIVERRTGPELVSLLPGNAEPFDRVPGIDANDGAQALARAPAKLAAPEAGPPALVAVPVGPELASLLPGDAEPFSRAPKLDANDAVYAPALQFAAPSAPSGIGAAPDLEGATEPPAAFVPTAKPKPADVRLVMHAPQSFAGSELAEAAENIAAATGFATETRPLVDFTISASNVRFFHPDDREAAAVVAEALSARLRDFTDFRPLPSKGTVEVWLSGNPVAAQPTAAVTQSRPTPAEPRDAKPVAPRKPVFRTSTTTRTRSGALRPIGQ